MNNAPKVILAALSGGLVVLLLFAASTDRGMVAGMGSMMGGGTMGGGMPLAVLLWGLVFAVLVALVVLVLDRGRR